MFGKATDVNATGTQSVIQEGVSIRGDLKSDNDIRLDGTLDGSLVCKARLVVGVTGSVRADIEGADVVVMGRVHGKITGHRRVELKKGAHVEGDLATQSLVIEEGVYFQGQAQMSPAGVPATAKAAAAAPLLDTEARLLLGGDTLRAPEKGLFEKAGTKLSN